MSETVVGGKTLALTEYDMQRKPQKAITDNSEIVISTRLLSAELCCPICLDLLSTTMATKECLHRFCLECITTALLRGNKECPTCRKKLVSKRSLRPDPNIDALISKIWPDRQIYDMIQQRAMDMFHKKSNVGALQQGIEAGLRAQAANRRRRIHCTAKKKARLQDRSTNSSPNSNSNESVEEVEGERETERFYDLRSDAHSSLSSTSLLIDTYRDCGSTSLSTDSLNLINDDGELDEIELNEDDIEVEVELLPDKSVIQRIAISPILNRRYIRTKGNTKLKFLGEFLYQVSCDESNKNRQRDSKIGSHNNAEHLACAPRPTHFSVQMGQDNSEYLDIAPDRTLFEVLKIRRTEDTHLVIYFGYGSSPMHKTK